MRLATPFQVLPCIGDLLPLGIEIPVLEIRIPESASG